MQWSSSDHLASPPALGTFSPRFALSVRSDANKCTDFTGSSELRAVSNTPCLGRYSCEIQRRSKAIFFVFVATVGGRLQGISESKNGNTPINLWPIELCAYRCTLSLAEGPLDETSNLAVSDSAKRARRAFLSLELPLFVGLKQTPRRAKQGETNRMTKRA